MPKGEESSLYIRPFMFGTEEFLGVKPSGKYRFMVILSPSGAYYSKPLRVKVETHYARAMEGGVGSAKTSGNYAAFIITSARKVLKQVTINYCGLMQKRMLELKSREQ